MFELNDTSDFIVFKLAALLVTGVLAVVIGNWLYDKTKKK
jgi:hypothetical protein